MKFCSTFAGAEDVGIVVDDLGLVLIHSVQDLFAFNREYIVIMGPC